MGKLRCRCAPVGAAAGVLCSGLGLAVQAHAQPDSVIGTAGGASGSELGALIYGIADVMPKLPDDGDVLIVEADDASGTVVALVDAVEELSVSTVRVDSARVLEARSLPPSGGVLFLDTNNNLNVGVVDADRPFVFRVRTDAGEATFSPGQGTSYVDVLDAIEQVEGELGVDATLAFLEGEVFPSIRIERLDGGAQSFLWAEYRTDNEPNARFRVADPAFPDRPADVEFRYGPGVITGTARTVGGTVVDGIVAVEEDGRFVYSSASSPFAGSFTLGETLDEPVDTFLVLPKLLGDPTPGRASAREFRAWLARAVVSRAVVSRAFASESGVFLAAARLGR